MLLKDSSNNVRGMCPSAKHIAGMQANSRVERSDLRHRFTLQVMGWLVLDKSTPKPKSSSCLRATPPLPLKMDQPPFIEPPAPETPPPLPPSTSLGARLLNVFATPGEVFAEVVATPVSVRNWLVPTLIACVVAMISVLILFSQPVIQQKLREQQQAAMDKNVAASKMTQAQADEAMRMIEKFSGPTMMKIFGGMGALVWSFAGVFLWAFGLWLLGAKYFKVHIDFMKAVEVTRSGFTSV